jgi:hypothetical protein
MPKLSASTPADAPTEITRVDITPEFIKSASDEALNNLLRELRGNREVAGGGKSRSPSAPRPAKTPEASLDDTLDDE